jgi:ribulose-bisphosphate carboxylase large chain
MTTRLSVTYRVRSDTASIAARAQAIAVEQSVEMPLEAIGSERVLRDIVGVVEDIADCADGWFDVRIGLALATIGDDAGQLMNMLFGNTSLHDDVVLHDISLPPELLAVFRGPHAGTPGLRARVGAYGRALTCSALKPQGLPAGELALLAERFARGRVDYIKDDHGLADQSYSRFAERVPACAEAVARAAAATGHPTRYVPSLSGHYGTMRRQVEVARAAGVDCVLIAPMVAGFATMQALVSEFPDVAFFAHPSLGGAARIAPPLLIGTLFRLLGADAVIFPNYGGRFGYAPDMCRKLADNARRSCGNLRPALPAPAGGMTLARVPELLDFYGPDAMLLIGGNLLLARENLTAQTLAFTSAIAEHSYRQGSHGH